jgi:hypothetical protein
MAGGGFVTLPSGGVVVALTLPRADGEPAGAHGDSATVRVIVHAANRQRALTRVRNLGFRGVRLAGNAEPPTPDEINAVLHHPDGMVWRDRVSSDAEPWHPMSTLRRPGTPR